MFRNGFLSCDARLALGYPLKSTRDFGRQAYKSLDNTVSYGKIIKESHAAAKEFSPAPKPFFWGWEFYLLED